jgi:hypothetical protein
MSTLVSALSITGKARKAAKNPSAPARKEISQWTPVSTGARDGEDSSKVSSNIGIAS